MQLSDVVQSQIYLCTNFIDKARTFEVREKLTKQIGVCFSVQVEIVMAMGSLIRKYEIPDANRPIPEDERGMVGPSGELIPFEPKPVTAKDIVGRRVDEVSACVGTYGMGGPGFFGIRLGEEWLIIALWGAGEWIRADGLLVVDHWYEEYGRAIPWICNNSDRLSPKIIGRQIISSEIKPHSMEIVLSRGFSVSIDESHEYRPILEGPKEPRTFVDSDDLRKAVFLSPTNEIWVE